MLGQGNWTNLKKKINKWTITLGKTKRSWDANGSQKNWK
jgi:hypothetical protein